MYITDRSAAPTMGLGRLCDELEAAAQQPQRGHMTLPAPLTASGEDREAGLLRRAGRRCMLHLWKASAHAHPQRPALGAGAAGSGCDAAAAAAGAVPTGLAAEASRVRFDPPGALSGAVSEGWWDPAAW